MSISKLLAFSILLGFSTFIFACDGDWTGDTVTTPSTSWNDPNAWSANPVGCIPGTTPFVDTDTATFTNSNSGQLITQDAGAITLQSLSFNGGQAWTIKGLSPTTITTSNTITFSNNNSSINVNVANAVGAELHLPIFITGNTQVNMTTSNSLTIDDITIQNNATFKIPNQITSENVLFQTNPIMLNSGIFESSNANPYSAGGAGNLITLFLPPTINTGSQMNNKNTGALDSLTVVGTSINGSFTVNGGDVLNSNTGNIDTSAIGARLSTTTTITVNSGTLKNHHDTGTITNGTPVQPSIGSEIIFTTMNITGGKVTNESTVVSTDANIGSLMTSGGTINIGSSGGTLLNNDRVRVPTINITTGGTLQGVGIYERGRGLNMTVNNSGFVEPTDGTTPGTMTITGNYTQSSSGTFIADLLSAGTFSHLLVNTRNQAVATTAQPGGALQVNFLPGNSVTVNDTFVIISTSGMASVGTGTFSTITTNSTTLIPHVQYIPGLNGQVILTFTAAAPTVPSTYAGSFIQTVLSDINHINSHITIKMEDLRGRFAAQGAMISRIRNNFIASANERFLAFNPETEEKQEQLRREVVETEKVRPGSFYFGPTGRAYGEIHSKDGDPGARFWSVGGLMGVDYAFSEVGIGAMADYERIFVHAKDNWGSIDVDELHASIYLTYSPSCIPLAINAIGGGAYEFYSIRRNTSTGKVRGKPNGFGYDALFGFEYAIGGCNFHFIPLANAQYIYLRAEKFNEKGSAGIHIDSQRVKSLRSSVGFRLNYYNETNEDLIVIPEFYAEWQREYMNRRRGIGIAPIAGIGGTILLPGTGRNIWLGGVDLLFTYRQKFGVELSYETEYNSLYHDHFFYLGANFRF